METFVCVNFNENGKASEQSIMVAENIQIGNNLMIWRENNHSASELSNLHYIWSRNGQGRRRSMDQEMVFI